MKTRKLFERRANWLAGLVSLSLAACQAPPPVAKEYPYLIKIRVKGCQGKVGKLFSPGPALAPLDSAKLEQGQFVFRGKVAHPGVYNVYCVCEDKTASSLDVYLPADSVVAVVTPGANLRPDIYQPKGLGHFGIGSYHLDTQLFTTAQQQREVGRYLLTRDSVWNGYFLDVKRMKAKMDAAIGAGNKPEIDRWADSTRRVEEKFPDYMARASAQFVKAHPHSEAVLFALRDAGDAPAARQRLGPYYQALPDSVRTSYFGQQLAKRFGAPETAGAAQ